MLNELYDIAFMGVGGGMLLTGVAWIIGGEVYTIDIDLSEYDFIANIVRWLLYGIFLIGLILLTNRLIGRG